MLRALALVAAGSIAVQAQLPKPPCSIYDPTGKVSAVGTIPVMGRAPRRGSGF